LTGFPHRGFPIPPWTSFFALSLALTVRLWLKARREDKNPFDAHPALFPFLLAFTFYLSSFRWHGGDDIPNSLLPFAILRQGTLTMEPFRGWFAEHGTTPDFLVIHRGIWVSIFPVAPGLLALPLYLLPVLSGAPPDELLLHHLSKIAASAITALSVALFHLLLRRRVKRPWAVSAALLYAFGSWGFSVSSQALYQHGPAQLCLILGLWGLLDEEAAPRHAALAGFGFASAFCCRPDSLFFLAAAGLFFLWRRPRRLAAFLAGAAPPLLLLAAYYHHYTGKFQPPDSQVQRNILNTFQPEALAGLILSPTRGLLLFMPAAVFGLWGMWLKVRENALPWALPLSLPLPALLIFYSFYGNWTGGQTFGTRYFATSAILLALFAAEAGPEIGRSALLRRAWSMSVAWSILVHALGAYLGWPGSYAIIPQKAAVWDWTLYPPLELLSPSGNLRALPWLLRLLIACAAAGAAWRGGRALDRWIERESA
jgi:hypothetical protein